MHRVAEIIRFRMLMIAAGYEDGASGVETSILDLANLVSELAGNPTPIAFAPARDWDRSVRRLVEWTSIGDTQVDAQACCEEREAVCSDYLKLGCVFGG